jgi:hypothetical protein
MVDVQLLETRKRIEKKTTNATKLNMRTTFNLTSASVGLCPLFLLPSFMKNTIALLYHIVIFFFFLKMST